MGDFFAENNGVNKVVKIYPTPLQLKKKENAIQVLTLQIFNAMQNENSK